MRRYAMYLGYAYAIYVTANLVLFFSGIRRRLRTEKRSSASSI